MSFLRHPEIFPSDGSAGLAANAPAHRLDEFPAGYSLAGWSPPGPTSASPAEYDCALKSSCRSRSFHRTAYCVLTVCVSRGGKRSLYCNEPLPSDQGPRWVTNACASISPILNEVALLFKSILPNTEIV